MDIRAEIAKMNELERYYLRKNLLWIIGQCLTVFKPPSNQKIWEWGEENVELDRSSPYPGPFRIKNSPHIKEILDAILDPECHKITIMGSAQTAKTLMYLIIWGYLVDVRTCNILIGHPSEREAILFSRFKLELFIENTPVLKRKVKSKKKGNIEASSTLVKLYFGGHTLILSVTAKGAARAKSAQVTMMDDEDAIEMTIQTEGDPASNFEKRTAAYKYNFLNISTSTPTIKGTSRIEKKYENGSRGKFYVKCPHCNEDICFDSMELVTWETDKDAFGKITEHYPHTAMIACPTEGCGALFNEEQRIKLLQDGFWIHEAPENKYHRSFHINQLSSTLSKLEMVAREYVEADEGGEAMMESFYNNVLGLPYERNKGDASDPLELIKRAEREKCITEKDLREDRIIIPEEVLLLTAWVDVQQGSEDKPSRLDLKVMGWGADEECWILFREQIAGNPVEKNVWKKLDEFWDRYRWIRRDGVELRISRKGVDSGWLQSTVCRYTGGRWRQGFIATKGSNNINAELVPKKLSLVETGRAWQLRMGVQKAASELLYRLKITEAGSKYIHFPGVLCDAEYFEELTNVVAITKHYGTIKITIYEKKDKHKANEAFDQWIGNFVLMKSMIVNWKRLKANLDNRKGEVKLDEPLKPKKKIKMVRRKIPVRRGN